MVTCPSRSRVARSMRTAAGLVWARRNRRRASSPGLRPFRERTIKSCTSRRCGLASMLPSGQPVGEVPQAGCPQVLQCLLQRLKDFEAGLQVAHPVAPIMEGLEEGGAGEDADGQECSAEDADERHEQSVVAHG